MKKLNNNQIKLVMVVLMTLNSLTYLMPANLTILYHALSKIAVGWFAFSAVEGVFHTSNLKRYNLRLYIAAAILFLGNLILNTGFGTQTAKLYDNAFFTLALGVSCLTVFKNRRSGAANKTAAAWLGGIALAICGILCQYGYIVIPVMLCCFFFKEQPGRRERGLILISLLLLISDLISGKIAGNTVGALASGANCFYILVVPFIRLYSGERGSASPFMKYFFYVYYPVHLWIIFIVRNIW